MASRKHYRSGMTLIELLIVVGLIAVIATLAVMFLPNLDRNKGVPNAVTQIEGYINLSKQQALRDKKPHGIRFLADPNDPSGLRVTALQYVEQPDPFVPTATYILTLTSGPGGTPPHTATLTNGAGTPVPWEGVEVGDLLQVLESPEDTAVIIGVSGAVLTLDHAISPGTPRAIVQPASPPSFKVLRGPRPLVGEPTVQLNKDVYIDLAWCYPCPKLLNDPNTGLPAFSGSPPYGNTATRWGNWSNWQSTTFGSPPDILFNQSGLVANATTGQIIIAVRHVDRPNDMLFVTVYTRTGKISAHSVNQGATNPYSFAQDGSTPGF